jgi:hypothetical protein
MNAIGHSVCTLLLSMVDSARCDSSQRAMCEGENSMEEKRDSQTATQTATTTQPGQPTETMKQTNPPRSNEHPNQTAEVPLGSGQHAEPAGGGGRESQQVSPDVGGTNKPVNP